MPKIICDNGHFEHYRNQRGTRIADMKCSQCGSAMHAAVWQRDGTPDGCYVRRTRASAAEFRELTTAEVSVAGSNPARATLFEGGCQDGKQTHESKEAQERPYQG